MNSVPGSALAAALAGLAACGPAAEEGSGAAAGLLAADRAFAAAVARAGLEAGSGRSPGLTERSWTAGAVT